MKFAIKILLVLVFQWVGTQCAFAHLLPVPGYGDQGQLYLDTASIVRNPPVVTMMYVENFSQPQSYGSSTYISKGTEIRLDCANGRLFALSERFYSGPSLTGQMLGKFPLYDQFGSTPVEGSWDANLLNLGCAPRRY